MNKQGTGIICRKIFFATSFWFLFGPTLKCNHFVQQSSSKKNFIFRNASRKKRYSTLIFGDSWCRDHFLFRSGNTAKTIDSTKMRIPWSAIKRSPYVSRKTFDARVCGPTISWFFLSCCAHKKDTSDGEAKVSCEKSHRPVRSVVRFQVVFFCCLT